MKRYAILLQCVLAALLVLSLASPAAAKDSAGPAYKTGFTLWRGAAGGFNQWTATGGVLIGSTLAFDPGTAVTENDPNGLYGVTGYKVGEAISPEVAVSFNFSEAIASWNADTPTGTWIETLMRAKVGGAWTKWYNMGVWLSGETPFQRHSVRLQGDASGYVATDTLVLSKSKLAATALQVKVRLFSLDGVAAPAVRNMSVAYSTAAPKKVTPSTGNPADWNTLVNVPECSQMVYPDGGNVWCSPTSTSMVLGYWQQDAGPCEPRVRAAVAGVYDVVYDGHGNWPFNTAYAATKTLADGTPLEGYVARYTSLTDLEPWLKEGVPVVMSIAWSKKELTGAAVSSSAGHLVVLVGFDANGNAIVNDPAAAADADVQRTYIRSELESVWLTNSGGTVYLIFPAGSVTPGL